MKAFFDGVAHIWLGFWNGAGKFVFDLFTDKQGNYDEKRVYGFGFVIVGILYGLHALPVGVVDSSFAIFLVSTGVGLLFGAGLMDGIVPPIQQTIVQNQSSTIGQQSLGPQDGGK